MPPKIHAVGQRQADPGRARVVASPRRSLDRHGKNRRVDDPRRVRRPPLHVLRRQLFLPVWPQRRRRAPPVGPQRNAEVIRRRGRSAGRRRYVHVLGRGEQRPGKDARQQSASEASREAKRGDVVSGQLRRLSTLAKGTSSYCFRTRCRNSGTACRCCPKSRRHIGDSIPVLRRCCRDCRSALRRRSKRAGPKAMPGARTSGPGKPDRSRRIFGRFPLRRKRLRRREGPRAREA